MYNVKNELLCIILLNFSNKYVCILLRISLYYMIFDGCRSLPLLDMWSLCTSDDFLLKITFIYLFIAD